MMNILLCFLPAILVLGLITSYEDIKFGKIRNRWIVSALIYFLIVNGLLLVYYFLEGGINENYITELITNFCFSLLVGSGLWYFRVWTAGDGKLFIAYSALIPLSTYQYGYEEWVPSLTLLMNMFVLGLGLMLTVIICKSKLRDIKNIIISFSKNFFQPTRLLSSVIQLFAIFWVINILISLTNIKVGYLLRIGITMLLMGALQKKSGKNSLYIMLAVSGLRFFLDKSVYSISFIKDFLVLVLVWGLIRSFIDMSVTNLSRSLFSKKIGIKKLRPGMLLNDTIEKKEQMSKKELCVLKKQSDIDIIKNNKAYYIKKTKSGFISDSFIDEEAEGLTIEQINKIKRTGIKSVMVAQTIPFAPIMFLGVILTLIAKGNILIFIKFLF